MGELNEYKVVSIISPLYNAELYIGRTMVSILKQTHPYWEWIVVDDGSTDKSYSILTQMKDPRINVIHLTTHVGAAKSRNIGLDNAKGDYIVFLDFYGELDPLFLKNQLDFIATHGPIVTGSYRRKTDNGMYNFIVPEKTDLKRAIKGNPISCLTTMYDFNVFKDMRFDENVTKHEDLYFWIKMLEKGYIVEGNQVPCATLNLKEVATPISKRKMVKPLYVLYRTKLGYGRFKSLFLVLSTIIFSLKKYKKVR